MKIQCIRFIRIGKLISLTFVFCILLLSTLQTCALSLQSDGLRKPIELNNWQYLWSPSQVDKNAAIESLSDSYDNPDWKAVKIPGQIPENKGYKEVYIRTKLPSESWRDPSIFLYTDHQAIDVYLDNSLIYKFGSVSLQSGIKTPGSPWHIIELPEDYEGKILSIRVQSPFSALAGRIYEVQIGSKSDHLLNILKENADYVILSALSIFIGLVLIFIFFLRKMDRNARPFLSLGFASLCTGVWLFSSPNETRFLLVEIPRMWYYFSYISFYLLPVGYCSFVHQMFGGKFSILLKRAWQFCIIYAVISFTLDFTNLVSMVSVLRIYHFLLIFIMILLIVTTVKASIDGNLEARYFALGFLIFSLFGVYDILGLYSILLPWMPRRFITQWGMFIFILMLVFVLSRRFVDVYDNMKTYSSEIQAKNVDLKKMWKEVRDSRDKVAELNKTLEDRVNDRTEQVKATNLELEAANLELKSAIENLQHAQAKLIESEKMSALGVITAGVAHEINTPVGIGVTAASYLQQETRELIYLYENNNLKKSDLKKYTETCLESSDMILNNLKRSSELIKSFKKIAADQSSEEKRVFLVLEYVNEVLLSLKPQFKNTKINIEVHCDEKIKIDSYPGAFSQIITNLVLNSLVHAFDHEAQGTIIINLNIKNNIFILNYSDNGKGIEKSNIDKIFNPFFTTKRGSGGTGLGLNIVYNIVTHTLNGTIICESEIGNGTTFNINFPI